MARRARILRGLVAAALGATVLVAGPPAEGAVVPDPPMGVVANSPTNRTAISARLKTLIDNAPAASTIRIAQYRLSSDDGLVVQALDAAFTRGVNIRIVLDNSSHNPTPFVGNASLESLRKKMVAKYTSSTSTANPSFIKLCSAGCIGTAVQHNKIYLFTKSGTLTNVVVQSTANVSLDNQNAWNAAYAVAGKTVLYNGFQAYFTDLSVATKNANYYRTTTDGIEKAYFFPRASSTGDADDPSTDTIVGILDNVSCTGSTTVGTSTNHRTIIRVAMWGFTREEVARKLRLLADQDCWVDVAINGGVPDSEVSAQVKTLLSNHPRINVDNAMSSPMWMHAKYLLIEGTYDGTVNNKVAWLGSHNFTINALRNSDESWLKVDSATAHDALRTQFRSIMDLSSDFVF